MVDADDVAPHRRGREHHRDPPLADRLHDLAEAGPLEVEFHQGGPGQQHLEDVLEAGNGGGRGQRQQLVVGTEMHGVHELADAMKDGALAERDALRLAGAARRVEDEARRAGRHRREGLSLGHRRVLQRLVDHQGAHSRRQQPAGGDVRPSQEDGSEPRVAEDRGHPIRRMVMVDQHARPVRRQTGQDRDGIGGIVRQQHADRFSGRDGGVDRGRQAPARGPDLRIGQPRREVLAGNPVAEFRRRGPEQVEDRPFDLVRAEGTERHRRAVQIEGRRGRIRPGDFRGFYRGHERSGELEEPGEMSRRSISRPDDDPCPL